MHFHFGSKGCVPTFTCSKVKASKRKEAPLTIKKWEHTFCSKMWECTIGRPKVRIHSWSSKCGNVSFGAKSGMHYKQSMKSGPKEYLTRKPDGLWHRQHYDRNLWLSQKIGILAFYRNYFLFKLIYSEYYIPQHSFNIHMPITEGINIAQRLAKI